MPHYNSVSISLIDQKYETRIGIIWNTCALHGRISLTPPYLGDLVSK